jgi:PAS domain S-box-containing protein
LSQDATRNLSFLYRSLFRNGSIGMVVADSSCVIVEANTAFCRMVRCERKELLGTGPPYAFSRISTGGEWKKAGRDFFEQPKEDCLIQFGWEGGTVYPARVTNQQIDNRDNGFTGYVAYLTTVSEWSKFEAELNERSDFLKAMLTSSGEIIFTKDLKGRYGWVSDAFAKLWGYPREEIVGKSVFDFFPARIANHLVWMDEKLLDGQPVNSFDTMPLGRNEDILNILKFPLHDVDGNITGLCGIIRVVTEQRRMEKALLRSQRADAMIGLAADIAHDFNNIIMGISGYVTMALQVSDESNPVHSDLKEIDRALEQAGDYTKKLLSLGSSMPARVKKESMREVVRNVVLLLERAFPPEIEIDVTLSDRERSVLIHKGQLERALINICVNARDAMKNGGKLSICLDDVVLTDSDAGTYIDAPAGDYCRVVLIDTGEGMSEEVIEQAIEPFFTTRGALGGAGLGLSIAYGIIKEHGGGLKIESQEGRGTGVEVLVPVADKYTGT